MTAPARSVFAEPLAQARAFVANVGNDAEPCPKGVRPRHEVLAALDLIEQRADEMEKALRRQAEREEENESRSRALGDHSGSVIHGYCATQLRFLIAGLSAREEAS